MRCFRLSCYPRRPRCHSRLSFSTHCRTRDTPTPIAAQSLPSSSSLFPRISLAPMVDVTDVHFRSFARIVSSSVHLYSEMVPAMKAISCPASLDAPMALDPARHHLQLGGSSLSSLLLATSFIPSSPSSCPYGSININMGSHSSLQHTPQLCSHCHSGSDLVRCSSWHCS